jgi:exodeoxyribonuclease V beta subunit
VGPADPEHDVTGGSIETFDLRSPLPTGTTVIEASAGTGKTYAIVGLAAIYLAEGITDLDHLMLVTFGRAATQELRDRARERFGDCAAALEDSAAARTSKDAAIARLATGTEAEVAARRARLREALSNFDAATIVTTHAFCERMLDGIGIRGDYQPEARLLENTKALVGEVTDDVYAAQYCAQSAPTLERKPAGEIANAATDIPFSDLVPADADPDSPAGQRVRFAATVRAEVTRRKRAGRHRDFNDLLGLLRDALTDPVFGPAAAQRIRDRYRVVLVDEFQDTDPVQWEILQHSFHGAVPLVLVGDPKQAIYAFRGADVTTYLEAISAADERQELGTNWRSDAELLTALEQLYGGAALGDSKINARPVLPAHKERRLRGSPLPPLRLRYLDRSGATTPGKVLPVGVARPRVAQDVADDIVATLNSGEELCDDEAWRPVCPGDIAVLVRTGDQGKLARDALIRAGVPCVLTGGASVFSTPEAKAWQRLLAALEQPRRALRLRLAALTPLIGCTAAELAEGGDAQLADLSARVRRWARICATSGPASMFETLGSQTDLAARLVGVRGGERCLTDLRHLAALLDQAATKDRIGVAELGRWLAQRIASDKLTDASDKVRLLDREAEATRIVTVHAAKGLEYPIVYVPYGWDRSGSTKPETLRLHEGGRRVLDVGGRDRQQFTANQSVSDREDDGEELRLLYVAATRAQCRVVLWWAPATSNPRAPLHRLLFGRTAGDPAPAARPATPADSAVPGLLAGWAQPAGELITVEAAVAQPVNAQWTPPPQSGDQLEVASFDRTLSPAWRRTSFSALTKDTYPPTRTPLSETEDTGITDEPGDDSTAPSGGAAATPSLMNGLPSGATFGNLVHKVLEDVDTAATDLSAEVHRQCAVWTGRLFGSADVDLLATALTAVLSTPTPAGTLATIAPGDRLVEFGFELPLAAARDSGTAGTVGAIADLVKQHLPRDDPLRGYPAVLRTLPDAELRGYLAGSLDAVLRVSGPRYVVVDYKTNRIFSGDVDAAQYDRAAMAGEMVRDHYPLQALLYSVALHRYLRWRQPDYAPEVHLGGVMYLFVRAMIGADTPAGCGVFDWHPPTQLVIDLSNMLAQS